MAGPAATIAGLTGLPLGFDIYGSWDIDKDGVGDFIDPYPNDSNRPGGWVKPVVISVPVGVSVSSFSVENNVLDTFEWEIISYPSWISGIRYGENGDLEHGDFTLSPGEKEKVTLYLDTSGLPAGTIVVGDIDVNSDLFGLQKVKISVQVAP